jgi:hypothetical protein
MMQWIQATRATYIGNATAVRDFRAQLRGNKALWLWGSYLAFLIIICSIAYNQFADQGSQSISNLQRQLTYFYHTIIGLLAGVVVLVTPGLTAAAITTEKQRRSIDLVFSAPVSPRYFLVGKMIAGLRYLIMLLILALPVVSVCVVMGGATWGDVLGSFINLVDTGIIMLAIGLLMSSIIPTTIGAILASYAAITAYLFMCGGLAMTAFPRIFGSGVGTGHSFEAPWYVDIFPFTASLTSPTFTTIGRFEVPNFLIYLVYALLLSKLLLAGAGSALSPYGSAETKSLRIHGLVASAAIAFLLSSPIASGAASAFTSAVAGGPGAAGGSIGIDAIARFLGAVTCATFFLWPHLLCHGRDSERKFMNDGLFSLRAAFRGTPAGSLPYLIMLVGAISVGLYAGVSSAGVSFSATPTPAMAQAVPGEKPIPIAGPGAGPASPGSPAPSPTSAYPPPAAKTPPPPSISPFYTMAIWCVGFLTFWWGVGRFTSSRAGNLKAARLGLISVAVLLVAIPTPFFAIISSSHWDYGAGSPGTDPIWHLHILYPLFAENPWNDQALYGMGCAVVGVLLALYSEKAYRSKYPVIKDV